MTYDPRFDFDDDTSPYVRPYRRRVGLLETILRVFVGTFGIELAGFLGSLLAMVVGFAIFVGGIGYICWKMTDDPNAHKERMRTGTIRK